MHYTIYKDGHQVSNENYKSLLNERITFIFHGLFGRAKNWHSIVLKMSSIIHGIFIVFDLRNHGDNNSSLNISYQIMVNDIYQFINKKNILKFSIIGHSMGGKLGMLFTLNYPDFVDQLFVVDIAPVEYPSEENEIVDHLINTDIDACKSRIEVDTELSKNIKDKNLRSFLLQNLKLNNEKYVWSLNLKTIKSGMSDLRGFPNEVDLKASVIKTICIYGEKSSYLNENFKKDFQRLFSNLKFEKVNDAGHWLHVEKSNEFIEIISKNLI